MESRQLYPLKLYVRSLPNIISLALALLLNIAAWVWLLSHIGPESGQVYLHYTILYGVDLTGTWSQALLIPGIGLIVLLVNAVLGWLFYGKDKFFAYLLNVISVFVGIIVLISTSITVFLNG